MSKLAELLRSYVGDKALLYTTDGASYNWLRCGSTPGVYATVDFGTSYSVLNAFSVMRMFSPKVHCNLRIEISVVMLFIVRFLIFYNCRALL